MLLADEDTSHSGSMYLIPKTPDYHPGLFRLNPSGVMVPFSNVSPTTLFRICNPKAVCKGFIILKATLTVSYPDAASSHLYMNDRLLLGIVNSKTPSWLVSSPTTRLLVMAGEDTSQGGRLAYGPVQRLPRVLPGATHIKPRWGYNSHFQTSPLPLWVFIFPNSKLQTPNSKLQTPNSKLQTPNRSDSRSKLKTVNTC
ncbi:hypothetical protein QE390_002436 [Siphonobacter sp. SORGH_AS 1065]|nr:hypothetical protein [Siphonobacter sp. SORGH_AS_1065]